MATFIPEISGLSLTAEQIREIRKADAQHMGVVIVKDWLLEAALTGTCNLSKRGREIVKTMADYKTYRYADDVVEAYLEDESFDTPFIGYVYTALRCCIVDNLIGSFRDINGWMPLDSDAKMLTTAEIYADVGQLVQWLEENISD